MTSPRREDLRWHDLRHTDAVLAAQTGAILAELMGRLGQPHQASPCGTSTQLPTAALRSPDGYLNWLGLRRLLDDSRRIGVWPDSVQVSGGMLSMRLPTRCWVWLSFGLQPVGHR